MVYLPGAGSVSGQSPLLPFRVAVHLRVPSLIVTVPVGKPLPGESTLAATIGVTGCPVTGCGVTLVIAVADLARLLVTVNDPVEGAKVASPEPTRPTPRCSPRPAR